MPKVVLVPAICLSACLGLLFSANCPAKTSSDGVQPYKTAHKARTHHRNSGLIPPPPPTAVSPTILAMYQQQDRQQHLNFITERPHKLAQDMSLTAVLDDVAFFRLRGTNESVHLKAGNTYESVTVAQINPDGVILEEKGLQYIKHLR